MIFKFGNEKEAFGSPFFACIFASRHDGSNPVPPAQFALILDRLAHQLIEHHDFSNTVLVGLQPRGSRLAERLQRRLHGCSQHSCAVWQIGCDVFRDDIRSNDKILSPNVNDMGFVEKDVVLVDDVLFTGRTIRAGLDAFNAHGRPNAVALAVLIDRRFSRNSSSPITWEVCRQHWGPARQSVLERRTGRKECHLLNEKPS